MKRWLAAVFLLLPLSMGSATPIVGYQRGFYFYKNIFSPESQILSPSSTNQFEARYGLWDTETETFSPYWPNSYPIEYPLDPYPINIPISEILPFGEFVISMYVHPYHPEIFPGEFPYVLPFIAQPSGVSRLGMEILYHEATSSSIQTFSSVIVFEEEGDGWLDLSDSAQIGQLQAQEGGFAIIMVPEPSSLSLLLAGGAVLMAGRRRIS